MRLLVGAFTLLALSCIVVVSRQRGIWLDEFWSQRLGDPSIPLRSMLIEQWLSDTHPPLANLLYRAVLATGATGIEAQRMILNIPAFMFLVVATGMFGRVRTREAQLFPLIVFGTAISLPGSIEAFTDFRTYGWQIATIIVLFQYARVLVSNERITRFAHVLGGCALFLALSLHYVTGIIISIFAIGLIAALVVAQRWRPTACIVAISATAWVSLTISGLILIGRMRRDVDFGWILTSTPAGMLLFGLVAVTTLLAVPLLVLFGWQSIGGKMLDRPQQTLALLLVWTLVAGFGALVCLNLLTPIIVQRYLVGWQLALVALVSVVAEPIVRRGRWQIFAVMAFSAFMTVVGAAQAAKNTGWRENRDRIAETVRRCPTARVYTLSPWRLKTARDSNSARRETVVIAEGYRRLANEGGFQISILDLHSPARLDVDPRCPTLVWIEHLDADYIPDVGYILRVGRLTPSVPVDAQLIASPSGMIVVLRSRQPG
jgi:hypothetical protein